MSTLEELRKTFADAASKQKKANAYCAVVTKDKYGDLGLADHGRGPCHGSLKSECYSDNKPIEFVLSSVQNLLVDAGGAYDYFVWLVNRSPWASVFITKDVDEGLKLGWVVDAHQPHQLAASALIASRFPTESYNTEVSNRFSVYMELLKLGYDEITSYLFACLFYKTSSYRANIYPLTYMPLSTGHLPFDFSGQPEVYFRNILKGTPTLEGLTFSDNQGYGAGITSIWNTKKDSGAFTRFMRSVAPAKKEAAYNYNIFYKEAEVGSVIKSAQDFKSVVDQILGRIYK